jgi:uncharacterized LabA/DUF88 family protein
LIPPVSGCESDHTPGFFIVAVGNQDRAIVFVDGNNWFHSLAEAGVDHRLRLNYAKLCRKLLFSRIWVAAHYYIGQVDQRQGSAVYANQRRFIAKLEQSDQRIKVHLGRIEPRVQKSDAARELLEYLASLKYKIDSNVFRELHDIGKRHARTIVWTEKAVDVMLAVDMVVMADRDDYDAAYVLSADGDYTGAVDYVRSLGKKVFAASPAHGAKLAASVNSFIPLKREWFDDCYD